MKYALTFHVEGPREQPSEEVYEEVASHVLLGDALGFDYAWFSEHHSHVHLGHLPCPLLFALHLAGRTRRIHLGTAVICLNMHHPVDAAEQVAVADLLTGGRISPGFGSGSTPGELDLFNLPQADAETRHEHFAASLRVIREVWAGTGPTREGSEVGPGFGVPLPRARRDLLARSWLAANSPRAASIAGSGGHNMVLSFLRTPEQYQALASAYHAAGGRGSIAATRAIYVGEDDASAWREAEPALRLLWSRWVGEGKIPRDRPEPALFGLTNTPAQFVVGGPETVARWLLGLRERVPFDTLNVQPRWEGLTPEQVQQCMRRFAERVMPRLSTEPPPPRSQASNHPSPSRSSAACRSPHQRASPASRSRRS
jgi:alkanesulfonate monooxygenase SsuD/methylene tetrahydromethanopterin reductase-like flavin-dependent oxidoreductase (luciferase family)